MGKGFIEIHQQPLSENKGKEIETNPEKDLAVLCANCHRMVHRKKDITLSIQELKEKINKGANNMYNLVAKHTQLIIDNTLNKPFQRPNSLIQTRQFKIV